MNTWNGAVSAALVVAAAAAVAGAQCPTTTVAADLKAPSRVIVSPKGNLIVAENGDAPNAGRVSIVDPATGARRTLLDGLPAGASITGEISGPGGLVMNGRTLYVLIGAGDGGVPGPAPGSELENPNPSSPIVSSLLEVKFSAAVEKKTTGFALSVDDHQALEEGRTLKLKSRGQKITVRLVADFENFVPNPRPDVPDNVRTSNPYSVELVGNALYVADASLNRIVRVDRATGATTTLVEFPPVPNALPFGPPVTDSVPDSVHVDGGSVLVTHLTGFPFGSGAAFVDRVDLATGERTDFITGLTTAIDVLPVSGSAGAESYYVLEFSTDFLGQPPGPGRLLRYDDPSGSPVVVADCLVSPTSIARDARTGKLYITSIFTGQVLEIAGS